MAERDQDYEGECISHCPTGKDERPEPGSNAKQVPTTPENPHSRGHAASGGNCSARLEPLLQSCSPLKCCTSSSLSGARSRGICVELLCSSSCGRGKRDSALMSPLILLGRMRHCDASDHGMVFPALLGCGGPFRGVVAAELIASRRRIQSDSCIKSTSS